MEMLKALGYANEAEASAALVELQQYQNGVVSALGASSPVDAVQRLTSVTAQASKLEAVQAELIAEKVKAESASVEAEIVKLSAEMKLAPAQHEFFRSLNASQREAFSAQAAPLVPAPSTPKALEANQVVLSATQEEFIAKSGCDRAKFIEQVAIDNKKEMS